MEKRSTVHAIYAESLVLESNFGPEAGPAANPGNAILKRAQWIPAWNAVTLACESVGTSDTPPSPVVH